jgi:XTP/dITP diphosphohydrolase
MDLIIASNNKHKIKEIKDILSPYFDKISSQSEAGIDAEIEEDAGTFSGNAEKKARAVFDLTGKASLADDSGLMVDALGGAPGVYSARYAGIPCNDRANNSLLLKDMEGQKNRSARFVCAVALVTGEEVIFGHGEIMGEILYEGRGSGGFGYDPLFYIPSLGKTFAEAVYEEKNSISHRYRALTDLAGKLR